MSITFQDASILQWTDFSDFLTSKGYGIAQINGVWVATGPSNKTQAQIDTKVQGWIDTYDITPFAIKDGVKRLKKLRTERYYLLYPPELAVPDAYLEETHKDLFGNMVDLTLDLWASVHNDARTANAGWQKVLDTRAVANTAITSIKAVTKQATAAATMAAVQAIIDAVVWPA
jgi:hypothetical protein